MNLQDLADQAWARYQSWLARQAQLPRTQITIFEHDVAAQVNEWRGIWHACELEIIRRESVAANG